MPHTAVWIHSSFVWYHFWDGKVHIMCVTYSHRDTTKPSECSMYLTGQKAKINTNISLWFLCINHNNFIVPRKRKKDYGILAKNGAKNAIGCIGTDSSYHVSWINVLHISRNTNFFEVSFRLWKLTWNKKSVNFVILDLWIINVYRFSVY